MNELNELVKKTHHLYKSFQYEESLEKCLDAYQKFAEESIEKKRFLFNLAVLYTRLNEPENAKNYLDKINDDSFIFPNLKDIALLYETLALLFINQNNSNEPNKFKIICECLEQSSIYYSKCKQWSNYCVNEIERAKILLNNKHKKQSYLIADKVLNTTLYLDESKIETIKILNNLAVLYAKDSRQKSNLLLSFNLFKKGLDLSNKDEELHFTINSNYLGILNRLNSKRNKNIEQQINVVNIKSHEAKVYFYFNLAYSKFIYEKYDMALSFFQQTLNLVENKSLDRDKEVKSQVLESISVCHFKLGNYVEAKKNLELALKDSNDNQVQKRLNSKINVLKTKFKSFTKNETEEKVDDEKKTKEKADNEKKNEINTKDVFKKENEENQVEDEENEDTIRKIAENYVKNAEIFSSTDEINKTTNNHYKVLSDSETKKSKTKISYKEFNNGSALNHPEDLEIPDNKSSRICLIM